MTSPYQSDLHAIVYTSKAVKTMSDEEIQHILISARARNQQYGVTGLLIYANGNFMQYLEGSHQAVLETFAIIRAHKLHHNIIELLNESITTREFSDWSMAYAKTKAQNFIELTESIRTKNTPQPSYASAGAMILRQFWNRMTQNGPQYS